MPHVTKRQPLRLLLFLASGGCLALAFAVGTGIAAVSAKDTVQIEALPSTVKGPGQNEPTIKVTFKGEGVAQGTRTLWVSESVDSLGFKGAPCAATAQAQIKAQGYGAVTNVNGSFSKSESINVNYDSGRIYVCLYLTTGPTTIPPYPKAVPITQVGATVAKASETVSLHS